MTHDDDGRGGLAVVGDIPHRRTRGSAFSVSPHPDAPTHVAHGPKTHAPDGCCDGGGSRGAGGRCLSHAAATFRAVDPLAVAVIEPAFRAALMLGGRPPPLEALRGPTVRVPTRFVRKYTLRARLEPSGAHEAVERGTGYARVPGDGGFGHAQLEDGEALAAHVLLRGRDPPRGDAFHGLSMKCGFGCFIGQIRNLERVLFQAAEQFSQNVRLCLTAPCRAPTPTSHAPA